MSAILSPCGNYRYRLERHLQSSGRTVAFVMLNPSTADAETDDPTIRRCIGFARSWGCSRLVVVNLFAFRATDPAELLSEASFIDTTGPENLSHLEAAKRDADFTVCAWGAHAAAKMARLEILAAASRESLDPCHPVMALGLTKDGSPRHPLFVRQGTALSHYRIRANQERTT